MKRLGYGVSGAIGASLANLEKRVFLFEGDGGFAQNLQELSTVKINNFNIKFLLMNDRGYMSIKQNQKNAFNGNYIGCDSASDLDMPDWEFVAKGFGINYFQLDQLSVNSSDFQNALKLKDAIFLTYKLTPNKLIIRRLQALKDLMGKWNQTQSILWNHYLQKPKKKIH